MGPRPFRRGNGVIGFQYDIKDSASMGPRPFRRGNGEIPEAVIPISGLQWGHVLSDVETVIRCLP